jgi:hypothetical protein
MRQIVFALAASIVMLISADFASADSCTQRAGECRGYAINVNQPGSQNKCSAEKGRCIARCKQGQKWFVGPGTGKQYIVDRCE